MEPLESRSLLAAISLIQNIGTATDTSGGTSLSIPVAQEVAAGHRVVVEFVAAKDTSSGFGAHPVVTDSVGNVYEQDYQFGLGSSPSPEFLARHELWSGLVTTPIPVGGSITIASVDASFQAKAASAQEFYGLDASVAPEATGGTWNFSGTDQNPTLSANITSVPTMFLTSFAILDSPANTLTLSPASTALASAATTDSAGAYNATIAPAYQIVTTAGIVTIDGTLDSGAIWGSIGALYLGDPTEQFHVDVFPNAQAGDVLDVTVTALDDGGIVDPGYTGTVHFSSTDPGAILPADMHFTPDDAGVKTFPVILATTGLQTIRVEDTVDGSIVGSADVLLAAGELDHFQIDAPAGVTAGESFSIVVSALDAFNNVIPTYTGAIEFTSSDVQATLPSPYQFTIGPGGDNGIHTFSGIMLRTADNQTINVTDQDNNTALGTRPISVIPAAASYFELAGPTTVNKGQSFFLTITAKDSFGNVASGFTGVVSLTTSDTLALKKNFFPAGVTFAPEDGGVRSIELTLSSIGLQSIAALDSTNTVLGTLEIMVTNPTGKVPGSKGNSAKFS